MIFRKIYNGYNEKKLVKSSLSADDSFSFLSPRETSKKMERYRITVTDNDDNTNVVEGLRMEEVLNIVLNETAQADVLWFKVELMEVR